MIKNYLKIAVRNLIRHKGYTIINILGLAIGIACSLLILLFVFHELSYDKFQEKADQMYRVYLNGKMEGQEMIGANTPAPLAFTVKELFPEVLEATRINSTGERMIRYEEKSFIEKNFLYADSTFFKVFSFPLLKGNPKTALVAPKSVVITDEMAKKYFGNEDPMDKVLKVNDDTTLYRVTGVVAKPPYNSHFTFDFLGSLSTEEYSRNEMWISNSYYTYLVLDKNASPREFEAKLDTLVRKKIGPQLQQFIGISVEDFLAKGNRYGYFLQPLLSIHFDTHISGGLGVVNDKKYVYIFSIVAIFILVIACINFMNLATARSANRAKEVGIRKVVGSSRGWLIFQFLTESILLTLISLIIALLLVQFILPLFNQVIELKLETDYLKRWYLLPFMFVLTIVVGLLAGFYPSFFLASFNPIEVLKGKLKSGAKSKIIRSALVISQFIITIIIFVGTFIIYLQLQFLLNKDLGFNKEQLIIIPRVFALGNQQEVFKNEILKNTSIIDVSFSSAVPSMFNNNNGYQIEGEDKTKTVIIWTTQTDENFEKTYQLKMAEGRFFSKDMASDSSAAVINEKAVQQFGFKNPLQVRLIKPTEDGKGQMLQVIGVVKDYHFDKLSTLIEPAVFILEKPKNLYFVSVKIRTDKVKETVKGIEKAWKEFSSDQPFEYFFMDQRYEQLYTQEKRTQRLTAIFSILSIFIACLGLFGLVSFIAEKRTKEIGIRKALGASIQSLFILLSREIILLIAISSLIAWPISYFIMKNWLQNFAFHIHINFLVFLATSLIIFTIAIATISFQIYKTARINPAEALKYE
jgi:putative ABC transport system permease protein